MSWSVITILSIPVITGLIGWITNWIAIRMLFRPRLPFYCCGIAIHGLIPRRQNELAREIARVVEAELINQHVIGSQIDSLDLDHYIETFGRKLIRQRLLTKLGQVPLLTTFLGAGMVDRLERYAIASLKEEIVPLKTHIARELEQHLQIRTLVEEKIASFQVEKMEQTVYSIVSKEFRIIEWMGGILGFLFGSLQVCILLL